ncbi:M61 family metallopeptidase [Synechococcus sp. CBW1002]|uniref:M61 family metallopeptidase n=1 Tax=Synechococcus sp. CBW1002 TaxID=1353134 RepID=UPI0018CF80A5|nr:PDZ domain-containing protein [Synechococcus sp. CBW1002]QPN59549.1 M61 family metallopeptidase [Synechococcus sp. CBW1002]
MPLLTLDLSEPHQHLVRARLSFKPRTDCLRFSLPRWTPGSYLLREYVRHLEGLQVVQAARVLQPRRLGPSLWQLDGVGPEDLTIAYTLQATELTVRTCHLSGDHGFLALAAVLLLVDGERWSPHDLELRLPDGWEPFVPLPRNDRGHWCASDADQLIDTPVEAGPHPCHGFTVAGVPHRWVGWGGDLPALDQAWLSDVEKVCLACCRLMGEAAPAAPDYLFVLHLLDNGYGGLEHDRSTVLQYGRRALARPDGRRKLLQLVAHEYLHQWNVRRLRPAELTPIDYGTAAIVPTLWFAEGVTSYFDQFLPLLAGCSDETALLEDLGADLSRYRLNRGRRVQSLRSSSEEAWVKLYRADAYSPDNQVSYYLKGAVLALVLDLHLRRSGSCLARVLRRLWMMLGRCGRGYREADLLEAFTAEAADLAALLPRWLEGTTEAEEPDLDGYLASVGLQLLPELQDHPDLGITVDEASPGVIRVKGVVRGGAAEQAGLDVGDELLAVDGQRLRAVADLETIWNDPLRPAWNAAADEAGPPVAAIPALELLVCRDGLVRSCWLQPGPPAVKSWSLQADPSAEAAALAQRTAWFGVVP